MDASIGIKVVKLKLPSLHVLTYFYPTFQWEYFWDVVFIAQKNILWKTVFLKVKVKVADPLDMNCHNPTYIDEYLTADISSFIHGMLIKS